MMSLEQLEHLFFTKDVRTPASCIFVYDIGSSRVYADAEGKKLFPRLTFGELLFYYSRYEYTISLLDFLYRYERAWALYSDEFMNIDVKRIFYQKPPTSEIDIYSDESDKIVKFKLDDNSEEKTSDVEIEKRAQNAQIKNKYIKLRLELTPANEPIINPVYKPNYTDIIEYTEPRNLGQVIEKIQTRPSLCLYARIAHHFLRQDNFIDEFMRACTARIDTVEARANATSYTVCPTGEEPTNWFSPPNESKIQLVEPWGNKNAKTNMSNWVTHYNGGGTHVITRSVEPLVAALISAYPTTIEFVGKESSIDVAYLRESIINGAWCGRIYDDDKQCHNMLTFLTLLLIASSSGIPMYASRGWTVVSKVWRDMVRTIQGDRWLARYTEATAESKTTERGVEINEERLLELAIKVIAITHVSEQKVQGFKPGALGYVRYVEKFYARMVKEDVLGQVKTKPWAIKGRQGGTSTDTEGPKEEDLSDGSAVETGEEEDLSDDSAVETGESKSDIDDKVNDPTLRFARRVRFMQEFSYPRDMDDLRDAVRFRLAHWLVLKPTQIQFV